MGKPCKYCGQSNTRKDVFGFCKKFHCFAVSGKKEKYGELVRKRIYTQLFTPNYTRNMFDGTPYSPRALELKSIDWQIANLFI